MRNKTAGPLAAALLLGAVAGSAAAEETVNLESTVIGNREEPKVLYIIPWKQADSLKRLDSTLPQTIGDVFAHREYSELQRELKQLQVQKKKSAD